jgi:hypothetical protein
MNRADLAKLALRKYAMMSHWHILLLSRIIHNKRYDDIINYDHGHNFVDDVPKLKKLLNDFDGLVIDLFAMQELINDETLIPYDEYAEYNKRFEQHAQESYGHEVIAFVDAITQTDCNITYLPLELQNLVYAIRTRQGVHEDVEDVEDVPEDVEPTPRPLDAAPGRVDATPERAGRGMQRRKAFSGILGY